jgi:hypothetical protein
MARNIAAKRHAKAVRRNAVVAAKRKAEAESHSLIGEARVAARAPIQHCLVTEGLFQFGMGQVLLARGPLRTELDVGVFLVDLLPCRVKDVFLRHMTGLQLDEYRERLQGSGVSLVPIPPHDARKLLREVEARRRGMGIPSHGDFRAVEALFGDVDANASSVVFQLDKVDMLGLENADVSGEPVEGEADATEGAGKEGADSAAVGVGVAAETADAAPPVIGHEPADSADQESAGTAHHAARREDDPPNA